jgi:hypothetical protein
LIWAHREFFGVDRQCKSRWNKEYDRSWLEGINQLLKTTTWPCSDWSVESWKQNKEQEKHCYTFIIKKEEDRSTLLLASSCRYRHTHYLQ